MSLCSKEKKVVLLLLNFHKKGQILADSGKPQMIEYYNKNKSGVDTFDKMVSLHSVSRKRNRWTVRVFYGILDQAALNATILYNLISTNENLPRVNYLKDLPFNLVKPHLHK